MNRLTLLVWLVAIAEVTVALQQLTSADFQLGSTPTGTRPRRVTWAVRRDSNGKVTGFLVKGTQISTSGGTVAANTLVFGMNTNLVAGFQSADLGVGLYRRDIAIDSTSTDSSPYGNNAAFGAIVRFSFVAEFLDSNGDGKPQRSEILAQGGQWLAGTQLGRIYPTMTWQEITYYNVSVGSGFVHIFTMSSTPYGPTNMVFSARFIVSGQAVVYAGNTISADQIKLDVDVQNFNWSSIANTQLCIGTVIFTGGTVGTTTVSSGQGTLPIANGNGPQGRFDWTTEVNINGVNTPNVVTSAVYDDVTGISPIGTWNSQVRVFTLDKSVGKPTSIFWDPSAGVSNTDANAAAASAPMLALVIAAVALVAAVVF